MLLPGVDDLALRKGDLFVGAIVLVGVFSLAAILIVFRCGSLGTLVILVEDEDEDDDCTDRYRSSRS